MSIKRNYFLKLSENFFNDHKLKRLFFDADKIGVNKNDAVVIYIQLQLATLNTGGKFTINSYDTDIISKIVIEMEQSQQAVEESLKLLEKFELLYFVDDNTIQLCTTDSFEQGKLPLTNAERTRLSRARKKESVTECNDDVTLCNVCVTDPKNTCNDCVTECNDIDIDIDKDIDKDININNINKKKNIEDKSSIQKEKESLPDSDTTSTETKQQKINYNDICDFYNNTCTNLPKIKLINNERMKHLKARLGKFSIEDLKTVFLKANASDFLTGNNNRGWRAEFDWLIRESNFTKTLEGKYDNVIKATEPQQAKNTFEHPLTISDEEPTKFLGIVADEIF